MAVDTASVPVGGAGAGVSPIDEVSEARGAGIRAAPRWQLWTALGLVYIIWGSTYLAIRFAIESVPSFAMLTIRYLAAGGLLYAFMRLRGAPAPRGRDWAQASVVGALLLLGGNGAAAWAIRTVPSGITAVVIAMSPLWMVVIDWLRPGGTRPSLPVVLGIVGGLAGIALLLDPASLGASGGSGTGLTVAGAIVLLVGTLSWATGSIYSRTVPPRVDPFMATAMQMLTGAVFLGIAGLAVGDWAHVDLGAISSRSALALAYLAFFGSIVAFSAYVWLLHHTTTARASTYAYVNPVVALLLGWALGGEALSLRTTAAAAVIIGSVVLLSAYGRRRSQR